MANNETIYDVVIIGGGPGGVGAAVEASIMKAGKILLIEKGDNHSQTIRKFYKDEKRVDKDWQGQTVEIHGNVKFFDGTKETTLDYFDEILDREDIDSRFNCEVQGVEKQGDIFVIKTACGEFKGKNVIVAIGRMGKPNKPSYKLPISLRPVIGFNLEKCGQNEKVIVVGGGDSAVEYAYELADSNDVTLSYRRDKITRANPTNQEILNQYIKEGKIRPKFGVDIESVENEKGKVKVNFADGTSEVFDKAVYALGGSSPVDFLKSCGIEVDEKGKPIFDENFETNTKGLFVAGDIAFDNGGSIAHALNHAYKIMSYIKEKQEKEKSN